ncbi:MAG: DNA repair protein RadC [Pasteurellaceae bacterium]|nr:DNA repair protein RadC [Pasteurellaceae bacterium]
MTELSYMPREKLLTYGAESLTDSELLAIFLRTGIKGIPVLTLAEKVLSHFGSLRGLLNANLEEFCQVKGLGQTQYVQLQAIKELNKRYLSQTLAYNDAITDPDLAIMYLQMMLEDDEREVFMALFLDQQYRLLKQECLFLGTINQTSIHPREIIKAALKYNAAAILVAHNHPSGSCLPSEADRYMTRRIEMACDLVDIRLVDHIIIGKGEYFSFEEEKLYEGETKIDEITLECDL